METITFKHKNFTMDCFEGKQEFPGITQGAFWNGFECPAFEKEVTEDILDALMESAAQMRQYRADRLGIDALPSPDDFWTYDEDTDTFFLFDPDGDPDEEKLYAECTGKKIGAHTYYDLGAFSWVWTEGSRIGTGRQVWNPTAQFEGMGYLPEESGYREVHFYDPAIGTETRVMVFHLDGTYFIGAWFKNEQIAYDDSGIQDDEIDAEVLALFDMINGRFHGMRW